jgi:two-component system chemotaxis response regulator CheY
MPKIDGFKMAEVILGDPAFNKIPILMLTTESGTEQLSRAKALGVKGWLVKPFSPDQLIKGVELLTK